MNRILLIAGCLLFGSIAQAQITLTQASYPASVLGTDSLKKTIYGSPFPSFSPMSGSLCDMTCLVDTIPVYFAYRLPTVSYQFADSCNFNLSSYGYSSKLLCSISSSSLAEFATNTSAALYDISTLTAAAYDSLFIPAQTSLFTAPHIRIAFSATLGNTWYSSGHSDLSFEVSVSAYSLHHAPCTARKYTYENCSVIGWGKMRVTDASGIPSDYLDVLQVKTVTQTIDSFFLSGSPMPVTLLSALNFTQGKQDTVYAQNFYREQEVTPLANVVFRDAGYTQPYKATTHIQRLKPVGVPEMKAGNISIYPNPLTERVLTLQLPASPAGWTYELVSLGGAIVQSGNIVPAKNTAQLEVAGAVSAGIYFLQLTDGSNVYAQQLVIAK
jgi:hypothetical protein